ncbi:MAG: helicase-related protein, partial [Caulobacteraceae bacterium]
FVDRRTSALMKGLARGGDLLAGLAADGAVSVEGHYVGHLKGLSFERAGAAEGLARRAIDAAAAKAVGPEVARRLGALAAEPDEAFSVQPDGILIWRGEAVGVIDKARPLSPTARLFGELGPWQARRRAQTRLDAFLAADARRRLAPLQRLQDAVAQGHIRGLARGLAWRLSEAGGVLARGGIEADLASLSRGERRALRSLGVRIGAFHLGLPALHGPEARPFAAALVRRLAPDWRPAESGLQPLREPAPPPLALGLLGRIAIGSVIVSVERLERLDQVLRSAPRREGGVALGAPELGLLEWTQEEAQATMESLGFAQFRTSEGALAWRRRRNDRRREDRTRPAREIHSAFAVLAPLASPPVRRIRRRPPRPRRVHG